VTTKTVLITGGNRGIGQQVARVLAEQAWDVLLASRDKHKGSAAATRLREATGGRVKAVELDVTDATAIALAVQKLRDGAIAIDALVNNAGIYRGDGLIETNFFGPLRVTLGTLPIMRDGGSITNVTSGLGGLANVSERDRKVLSNPKLTRAALVEHMTSAADDYSLSKAALEALTRIFALELAPRKIRVNATDPGWVRTDMGGRGAPRSVEEGAASVLFGVTTTETGGVFRDGRSIR
jgi:NAD(P)-dependent dehydrogenase (short-subunit alcohol dehydrogenase family)